MRLHLVGLGDAFGKLKSRRHGGQGHGQAKNVPPREDIGGDDGGGEEGLYGDRIVTDRPQIAEAASTVGLGRVQVENGYTFSVDNAAGTTTQLHSYPETLVRAGLFQEWFEFRIQYNEG
jgi:hypothetical protein